MDAVRNGSNSIGEVLAGGIINDTWLVEEDGRKVVLQRVNTRVFPNPETVMENMLSVTSFIKKKLLAEGRDPLRETLTYLPDEQGHYLTCTAEGIYRKSLYIEDTFTLRKAGSPEQMREAGRCYGDFQRLLMDFPAESLHETLPGFHDTALRYQQFAEAVEADPFHRNAECREEIDFLSGLQSLAVHFRDCKLPVRVTHNDTKIANLLFDQTTGKALAVIDLETVMPGFLPYDFGDAIRTGAASLPEDDPDYDRVQILPELYQAFLEGFLDGIGDALTDVERVELHMGAKVIIYEQAMRFLTDYLKGDVYYKTEYPGHNLVRARNQICLLKSI